MTKVTILCEQPQETKKKPIEAIACLQSVDSEYSKDWVSLGVSDLSVRRELKVIKVSGYVNFDCIIIDENNNIFLGHFNDGIV